MRVTATNSDGSDSAASNPTDVVKAAGQKPASTNPPTISGKPAVGQTLTADRGDWSGSQPISFSYQWRRCDEIGGSCSNISGATSTMYTLKPVDVGNTLRIRVAARNSQGTTSATSVPTAVIQKASTTPPPSSNGCPGGSGPVQVGQLSSPARLVVDRLDVSPRVLTSGTQTVVARFHVSACNGRSVQGALVYGTAVPYNQFSVPTEQATAGDGWVTLTMHRLSSYPLSPKQGLLVMFVRARKPGDSLLAGISTRRLVSVRVDLSR